jgi:hypothetical protein
MNIRREEVKLSLFIYDMIVSTENPKGYIKMITNIVGILSNVSGVKTNRN